MNTSKRNFFGIGAAIAAAAAVPETADAKPSGDAVGPILLERICDGGRSEMTPEEIEKVEASWREEYGIEAPGWLFGCGTKFQWYYCGNAFCPNCGRVYWTTIEMLKSGKYTVRK